MSRVSDNRAEMSRFRSDHFAALYARASALQVPRPTDPGVLQAMQSIYRSFNFSSFQLPLPRRVASTIQQALNDARLDLSDDLRTKLGKLLQYVHSLTGSHLTLQGLFRDAVLERDRRLHDDGVEVELYEVSL